MAFYGMHMKFKSNPFDEKDPHMAIGWSYLGDLSNLKTKVDLERYVTQLDSSISGTQIGTIARFLFDVNIGDYIIYGNGKSCYIGKVTSDYYYKQYPSEKWDKDYVNNRKIKWLKEFPRDILSESAKNSLSSLHSIFSMDKHAEELNKILNDDYLKNVSAYNDLLKADDIDADTYDGSYKLLNVIMSCYKSVNLENVNYKDLNLLYFSVVGTCKRKFEKKKEYVEKSNLSLEDKNKVIKLIDELEEDVKNKKYLKNKNDDSTEMGIFGTGIGSLGRVSDEDASNLMRILLNVYDSNDNEAAFKIIEEQLPAKIKHINIGVLSSILYTLKPYYFPIIVGQDSFDVKLFLKLGINIIRPINFETILYSFKNIKKFRDFHFKFKNYRVFDVIARKYYLEEIDEEADNDIVNDTSEVNVGTLDDIVKDDKKYTRDNFLSEVFINDDEYETLTSLLERKNNILLVGVPGVGKTFMAKRLAYSIIGYRDDSYIEYVQFHQSYSYEDFVGGYVPDDKSFHYEDGIFVKFCQKAKEDPDSDYFLIIDEINRGNLSKIFGELLTLIESDKRDKYQVTLGHKKGKFSIPKNLYIIGLMNIADRSLTLVDYALRRRFSQFYIKPAFKEAANHDNLELNVFRKELVKNTNNINLTNLIIDKFNKLNAIIDKKLGENFEIGHSYFCTEKLTLKNYSEIIEYDIAPILREYFFDDLDEANALIKDLAIEASDVEN